ncbi:hypothetical protein B0T17DRAFT_507016 [Bombardia bombarda]|uniref:Uncharacterized protein n=1 Tax=Bombardia bombarda TaxID=252184 RepID=A0AA39XAW1_9PEZI|nr:hypothetical protein B0T17DRAFT_507016 [Bombardia bombarda]
MTYPHMGSVKPTATLHRIRHTRREPITWDNTASRVAAYDTRLQMLLKGLLRYWEHALLYHKSDVEVQDIHNMNGRPEHLDEISDLPSTVFDGLLKEPAEKLRHAVIWPMLRRADGDGVHSPVDSKSEQMDVDLDSNSTTIICRGSSKRYAEMPTPENAAQYRGVHMLSILRHINYFGKKWILHEMARFTRSLNKQNNVNQKKKHDHDVEMVDNAASAAFSSLVISEDVNLPDAVDNLTKQTRALLLK